MPKLLSFLTSRRWDARTTGLNDIPVDEWPDSVPLVYYAYHIMVGLGTILLLIALLGVILLWRGALFTSKPMLWALMLAFPFTYIANIAGWVTAETGRQPWIVYGLLRTKDARLACRVRPRGDGPVHAARVRGAVPARGHRLPDADRAHRQPGTGGHRASDHLDPGRQPERVRPDGDGLVLHPRGDGHDLRRPRRLRPRRRRAAPLPGPQRGGARGGHGRDRAGLERQRGVAARKRRCAVHGVPEGVRGRVQRPLLRPHHRAVAAGRPRARPRVPPPARQARCGAARATPCSASPRPRSRSCSASRWATSCEACRLARTATSRCRSSTS